MTDDTLPPRELRLLGELDRRREDERDEREERRGLENRASALLAAGAAVIGLVATAVLDLSVSGSNRVILLVGVGMASFDHGHLTRPHRGRSERSCYSRRDDRS